MMLTMVDADECVAFLDRPGSTLPDLHCCDESQVIGGPLCGCALPLIRAKLGKPRGTPRCCGASGRRGTVAAGDTVTTGSSAKGLKGSEGLQRL